MRPIKLTMQAFGAYAKKEVIDFEKLGTEQIFVISGKTGAGKSTIFDAISFAIFGKANTFDRESFSMRSHFATDKEITEVTLAFRLKDKIYQISRIPQQEIAKQRGNGTTTSPQKAELYELIGDEMKLLASSVRDVNTKMEELIQLNVDQFRQILMIPQGEFRELLVSDSKEKEVILQRLAHTVYYEKVENLLWEKQKQAEILVVEARKKVAELAELSLPGVEVSGKTTSEISVLQAEAIQSEQMILTELENKLSIIRKQTSEAVEKVTLAKEQLLDWQNLDKYTEEIATLEIEKDFYQAIEVRLEAAKRASNLRSQDALCIRLKEQLETAEQTEKQVAFEAEEVKVQFSHVKKQKEALAEKEAELEINKRTLFQLEEMEPKILELEMISIQKRRAELEWKEATTLLEEIVNSEQKIIAELQSVESRLVEINQAELTYLEVINKRTTVEAIIEKEQELVSKRMKMVAWDSEKQTEEQKLVQLLAEKAEIETTIEQEETKLQKEQAATIAAHLHDGEACPVCGSDSHPALAKFGETANLETLEVAKGKLHEKLLAITTTEKTISQLEWQLNEWAGIKELSLTEVQQTLTENIQLANNLAEQIAQLQAKVAQKETIQATLESLNNKQNETITEKNKVALEVEKLHQQVQMVSGKLSYLEQSIPTEFRDKVVFESKKKELSKKIEAHIKQANQVDALFRQTEKETTRLESTLQSAQKTTVDAKEALQVQREIFKEAMKQNDFLSYDAYKQAFMSAEEQKIQEEKVADYERKRHLAVSRQADLKEKLQNKQKPNIEQLEFIMKEKQLELSQSEENTIKQREFVTKRKELVENYQNSIQTVEQAEENYADIGLLADAARGKNARRLTFERYILAMFLDTIIHRANHRLSKMTSGRFELQRKMEKAKGNVQSGLELEVFDEYTGLTRHVKTLSGGESFKTSLALALSLAEVVQEMAGGISLETMFIDEGFGTLDPESLEAAVECLLETQENGRLVGIISHVPELKERISARLEVTATNHGSTTKFITASS
ncbi:SbcC/MukB-like Walker B domain-containing protein [Listeria monocytogenes]|uniref:SbcC/MukB-like Walker B domain-containing protein n=1 Tax=Listeria monocytogenes TaxID=1639 RepID=UPI000B546976|nr:SMC family ATPase [Listeria monocytogenes]ASH61711.1 exonuclease SbcC [Listeria monocytogenes serotype 1/2a str. 10-0933]ASH64507.1 exonuclease SbcC [Listeria monocytogenes serotype 1/2a str. 10-0934]EAA0046188.1 SMC family ATPase [Listeria monocytogenes]EAA0082229.1 SMC family ATPase [Listeria monocytogenes]EAC4238590.1 SMC family ATPase [Listeria monocytogenes]